MILIVYHLLVPTDKNHYELYILLSFYMNLMQSGSLIDARTSFLDTTCSGGIGSSLGIFPNKPHTITNLF